MFPTARYDSEANRFAPHTDYIDIEGFDFTGAVCKLQIRDRKNGGALRADLVPAVSMTMNDDIPVSRILWTVSEALMEAMPMAAEIDPDVTLWLDLHLTPDGGVKFVPIEGTFKIKSGVTE